MEMVKLKPIEDKRVHNLDEMVNGCAALVICGFILLILFL